jgi:hypothetical protein
MRSQQDDVFAAHMILLPFFEKNPYVMNPTRAGDGMSKENDPQAHQRVLEKILLLNNPRQLHPFAPKEAAKKPCP